MTNLKDNMGMGSTLSFDKRQYYDGEEYFYIRITSEFDLMAEEEKNLGYCLTKQQALLLANNLMEFINNKC